MSLSRAAERPSGSAVGSEEGRALRPLVSVVLPTRNRVQLLRAAVQTVLEQTWEELELLVVDDASTDGTAEYIEAQRQADARVRYIRFDRRRGAAAARNAGIAESRGAYVVFQDDDCVWTPDRVSIQVGALEAAGPAVGFAYSPAESVELDGTRRIVGAQFPGDKYRGPWTIGTWGVTVRREPLLRVGGFDETLPRLQDFDLWVRLLVETQYIFVPRVLIRTVRVQGGISTSTEALLEAVRILARKYRGTAQLPRRDEEELYHKLGDKLMRYGHWLAAVRLFAAALRVRPFRSRTWLALAAAVGGSGGYRLGIRIAEAVNWRGAARPVPFKLAPMDDGVVADGQGPLQAAGASTLTPALDREASGA